MGIKSPPLSFSNPPQSSSRSAEEAVYCCTRSPGYVTCSADLFLKFQISDTCVEPESKKDSVDAVFHLVPIGQCPEDNEQIRVNRKLGCGGLGKFPECYLHEDLRHYEMSQIRSLFIKDFPAIGSSY